MLDLALKSLEVLKFNKIRVKKWSLKAITFEAGRFEFQKRSGFSKGKRDLWFGPTRNNQNQPVLFTKNTGKQ